MLGALALAVLVAVLVAGCARGGVSGGTTNGTTSGSDVQGSLVFGGLTRTYTVHLPPSYDGVTTVPLFLVLHGRLGTGSGMIALSGMNTTADEDGFVAVYPDGYERGWADGRGTTPADKAGVDDVGFLSTLIDTLATRYRIDTHRVYVTGLSNGGIMTERLACDLAGKIAAAVAVAGSMSVYVSQHCTPARPVPFLVIQGTADPLVLYGGSVTEPPTPDELLSAAATTATWVALDGCTGAPTLGNVPNTAHDGTSVSSTTYSGCAGGSSVAEYVVQNGGHTWPSGEQYLPKTLIGATTHQIDNATIWDFVRGFSL